MAVLCVLFVTGVLLLGLFGEIHAAVPPYSWPVPFENEVVLAGSPIDLIFILSDNNLLLGGYGNDSMWEFQKQLVKDVIQSTQTPIGLAPSDMR